MRDNSCSRAMEMTSTPNPAAVVSDPEARLRSSQPQKCPAQGSGHTLLSNQWEPALPDGHSRAQREGTPRPHTWAPRSRTGRGGAALLKEPRRGVFLTTCRCFPGRRKPRPKTSASKCDRDTRTAEVQEWHELGLQAWLCHFRGGSRASGPGPQGARARPAPLGHTQARDSASGSRFTGTAPYTLHVLTETLKSLLK